MRHQRNPEAWNAAAFRRGFRQAREISRDDGKRRRAQLLYRGEVMDTP